MQQERVVSDSCRLTEVEKVYPHRTHKQVTALSYLSAVAVRHFVVYGLRS